MRWFTSDLHLGHENIIAFCGRPYSSVAHMNAMLIANWNANVAPGDEVFVLGDVALGRITTSLSLVGMLNGRKYLIPGNHDRPHPAATVAISARHDWTAKYIDAGFDVVYPWTEEVFVAIAGQSVRLCHFPRSSQFRSDNRFSAYMSPDDGNWLLHGHTHVKEVWTGERSIHIGTDAWDYQPVPEEWIASMIEEDNRDKR